MDEVVDTSTKHLFSARATLSQSPEQDEHVENPVEGNVPLAEEREKKDTKRAAVRSVAHHREEDFQRLESLLPLEDFRDVIAGLFEDDMKRFKKLSEEVQKKVLYIVAPLGEKPLDEHVAADEFAGPPTVLLAQVRTRNLRYCKFTKEEAQSVFPQFFAKHGNPDNFPVGSDAVARDFDLYPVLKRYDTFTVSLKDEDDPEAEPYYMIYETVKSGCNMSKKPPGDIKSLISRRLGHGWECYAKKQNIRYGDVVSFSRRLGDGSACFRVRVVKRGVPRAALGRPPRRKRLEAEEDEEEEDQDSDDDKEGEDEEELEEEEEQDEGAGAERPAPVARDAELESLSLRREIEAAGGEEEDEPQGPTKRAKPNATEQLPAGDDVGGAAGTTEDAAILIENLNLRSTGQDEPV